MTVSNHTALYRFTFPNKPIFPENGANSTSTLSPVMLIELADLADLKISGEIAVNPDNGRLTGSGRFYPSFGLGTYTLHFCADFSGASARDTGIDAVRETGIFTTLGKKATLQTVGLNDDNSNTTEKLSPQGAYVQFWAPNESNQLLARVGVSFINQEQACRNAQNEIPDFDFEATQSAAEDAWKKTLSPIEIDSTGVEDSYLTVFWSGIYRTFISPQDYTGENPLWESDEPYYDSFYWYTIQLPQPT